MKQATQLDIARQLHVTRVTVSKALRDHADISSAMKKKVRAVANKLGYTPNLIAQNLTSGKTLTLGVVVPDLENSFFAFITDSIIDAAAEKNYSVFVTVSRENQNTEKKNLEKLLGMRVDGMLVCISQQTNDPAMFLQIKKRNIPMVFFDRQFEGLQLPHISFDDRQGAMAALASIIEEGYTRIAHIAGYSNISIGRERCAGYREALKKAGIRIRSEWIIEGGFEVHDGYKAFMQLYRARNLPELFFAVNDRAAFGVYQAAKKMGVRIPEDVGIVAYGFNDIAQTFTPPLSVINQNPRILAQAATDLLIGEMTGKKSKHGTNNAIPEEFIWNSSICRRR